MKPPTDNQAPNIQAHLAMCIGTKVKWKEEALQTPCIMLLMKYKSVKLGMIVHLHFVFLAKQ